MPAFLSLQTVLVVSLAFEGWLLMASDGLLKYAAREVIARVALEGSVEEGARGLVECVRLPSGMLRDDLAVILCDPAPSTD